LQSLLEQSLLEQSLLEQSLLEQSLLEQSLLEQSLLEQSLLEQSLLEQSLLEQSLLGQNQNMLKQNMCVRAKFVLYLPHMPRLIVTIHVRIDSGGLGNKKSFFCIKLCVETQGLLKPTERCLCSIKVLDICGAWSNR
jgi:hypothetical protein